ncbi:MAG: hypothetical protein ACK52W_05810 [Alphaproteobacteria bacterium]
MIANYTLRGMVVAAFFSAVSVNAAWAEEPPAAPASKPTDEVALAKKLSNPVADLISVPLQLNYNPNIGPTEGGNKY